MLLEKMLLLLGIEFLKTLKYVTHFTYFFRIQIIRNLMKIYHTKKKYNTNFEPLFLKNPSLVGRSLISNVVRRICV